MLPMQGTEGQSPDGELRSHVPSSAGKKKKNTIQDPTEMGPCPPWQLQQEDQPPCSSPGKEVTGIPKEEPGPQSQPVLGPAQGAVVQSGQRSPFSESTQCAAHRGATCHSPPIWYQVRQTQANGNLHTFWPIRKLSGYLQCTSSIPNTGATAVNQSDKLPANQS